MEVESLYNVVCILLGIISTIFTGGCLAYYCDSFMEQRKWFGKYGKYLLITAYVITDYILDYCFQGGYETKETLGKLVLLSIAVFVFGKLFYQAKTQMAAFLTITFMAIRDLSSFIGMMVVVCGGKLFNLWVLLLEKEYVSVGTTEQLIDVTASILQTLMVACYMVLLYRSLKAVLKYYRDKEYPVQRQELLFLLTPGCVGFLLCVMLRTILLTMENGVPQDLYGKYPILMLVIPAILILSLLSIVYSVKLFQDMIMLNREKSDKLILEKQIKNMQEHMTEMEHIYSGVRSMKHDMKNTLSVIMQLAGNDMSESHEDLQKYLSELNQTMDRLDFQYKTGNSVVDVLLNMKYHELTRSMPEVQLKADRLLFPENLQIQGYDIGIIIGNALDNAIEACKKLKEKSKSAEAFITLSSFTRGKMFFIEVENSFDGKIIRKKYSEFPVTDKKDKKAHGIGLSNIKNTAEKYHGGVDWSVENKKFTLTIMLQNERRDEHEF